MLMRLSPSLPLPPSLSLPPSPSLPLPPSLEWNVHRLKLIQQISKEGKDLMNGIMSMHYFWGIPIAVVQVDDAHGS